MGTTDSRRRGGLMVCGTTSDAGKSAVVSSFGAESAVLLHMVAQIDPATPILFLNTGKLFGETLRYRDRLQDELGLGIGVGDDAGARLDVERAILDHPGAQNDARTAEGRGRARVAGPARARSGEEELQRRYRASARG